MPHTCHATACNAPIPEARFMCKPHWFALPAELRARIWATYRPGQEDDKNPSNAYCTVAKACVEFIAAKEKREPNTRLYDMYLESPESPRGPA